MEKPTEYAALDFDGTERRANYRTVAYRIDILHLCERKDAAAILYEIIYRWQTEVRKPEIMKEIERRKKANLPPMTEDEVENMMWVWMSYNDFVRESGGAVAYNTVIRMLDYLVEDAKIVECRENHDPRYPDYEYRVRLDIVKEKLKALPATPAFLPKVPKKKSNKGGDSTHLGRAEKRSTQKGRRAQRSTQVGTDSTQMGTATTQEGRGVYPDGGTSHTTTHTSHIEHTEGTYRASGSQGQECAVAQSAPTVPYHPDFNADQSRIATDTEDTSHGQHNNSGSRTDAGGDQHDRQRDNAGTTSQGDAFAGQGQRDLMETHGRTGEPDQRDGRADNGTTRTTSQQNTATVTPAGGSGYKTPAEQRAANQQNSTGTRPATVRTQPKQNEKPQLTLMGQQVREAYEVIRATRLRLTASNVKALNDLGDMDGMDFANLKETIELIEAQNLVKSRNIPIDVQELASEKGYWRFDKWYPVVLRNRQKQAGSQPKGDNNLSDWVAESQQQQSQMSREESARRTEEARKQLAAVQQQIAASRAAERQQQAVIYRVKGETYA